MRTELKKELAGHILDRIDDGVIDNNNRDDWHYHCFNEDYYIIGYYNCTQWLEQHDIDAFEAIGICTQYELDNFGEVGKVYDDSEKTVNMLVYIYGEELLGEIDAQSIKELKKACKKIVKQK